MTVRTLDPNPNIMDPSDHMCLSPEDRATFNEWVRTALGFIVEGEGNDHVASITVDGNRCQVSRFDIEASRTAGQPVYIGTFHTLTAPPPIWKKVA